MSTEIKTYWANVKTSLGGGGFIRVTVQAESIFIAGEILKNTYGHNLMTGPALLN